MVTAAIPPLQYGASSDTNYQKEYFDAVNEALKTLQERRNPNAFSIGAAFLDPGRTGSFGEALGKAAGVIGKQQEEEELRAPQIAQMRAALAGQKFQIGKQANAMGLLTRVVGLPGATPSEALARVNPYDPGMMGRLNSIYPYIAQDKETAGIVDKMFDQYAKMDDLVIKQRQAGATDAELLMKYGKKIQPLLGGTTVRPVAPTASAAPTAPATVDPDAVPIGVPAGRTPEEIDAARERGETPPAPKNPADELAPVTQEAITKEQILNRQKEDADQWKAPRAAIFEYGPSTYNTTVKDMKDLLTIKQRSPEVFGVLKQNPGFLQQAMNLVDEGVSVTKLGSINIPLSGTVYAGMDTDKQADAARAAQILARQFFLSAKADKASIPGPVSNYEEKLLQAPLATMKDLPKVVEGYAKRQLLLNEQRREMYDALHDYDQKLPMHGLKGPFFSEKLNPVFAEINGRYRKLFERLGVQ